MSAFGFIIVLGIVVDDAIVTGENVYAHMRRGDEGLSAAIHGTKEVAIPVTFGISDDNCRLHAARFYRGRMGQIFAPIPCRGNSGTDVFAGRVEADPASASETYSTTRA